VQLLDGKYDPITAQIGFLECDARTAAEHYEAWVGPLLAERRVRLVRRELVGSVEAKLESLLPLTSVEERRTLFLPTQGLWTAYFDNGWQGPDVASTVSYLSILTHCRGIRADSVPDTIRKEAGREVGRYGATMLEVYAAEPCHPSLLNTRRAVSVVNDGGHWGFDSVGDPFEFEDLERYKQRRVRDRFSPELLDRYLRNFGIRAFDRDFYETDEPALIISRVGPCVSNLKEYTLEEARAGY
jgi:hypothetical protein